MLSALEVSGLLPAALAKTAAVRVSAGVEPLSVVGWWNGDHPRSGSGACGPVWSSVLGHDATNTAVRLAGVGRDLTLQRRRLGDE